MLLDCIDSYKLSYHSAQSWPNLNSFLLWKARHPVHSRWNEMYYLEKASNDMCSASCSLTDNCSDLNSELQRVLTGLESVLCGRKKSTCSLSVAEVDRHIEQLTTASEHCDLAIKVQNTSVFVCVYCASVSLWWDCGCSELFLSEVFKAFGLMSQDFFSPSGWMSKIWEQLYISHLYPPTSCWHYE